MNTKIPGTKLTIIIRDDSPVMFCGDVPSYRRVTIDLSVKSIGKSADIEYFEAVSKCFIE